MEILPTPKLNSSDSQVSWGGIFCYPSTGEGHSCLVQECYVCGVVLWVSLGESHLCWLILPVQKTSNHAMANHPWVLPWLYYFSALSACTYCTKFFIFSYTLNLYLFPAWAFASQWVWKGKCLDQPIPATEKTLASCLNFEEVTSHQRNKLGGGSMNDDFWGLSQCHYCSDRPSMHNCSDLQLRCTWHILSAGCQMMDPSKLVAPGQFVGVQLNWASSD